MIEAPNAERLCSPQDGFKKTISKRRRCMKKLITICAAVTVILTVSGVVQAMVINFDDVAAPDMFLNTTHLTDQYASLGVHFSGPSDIDGGAILNQSSNFGVNALSGVNFLAFNRGAMRWMAVYRKTLKRLCSTARWLKFRFTPQAAIKQTRSRCRLIIPAMFLLTRIRLTPCRGSC